MSKWAVLSGGGSKGAAQVGMLRTRLDQNPELDYRGYAGISVGALNSCFLSQGKLKDTLPLLEDIWLKKIKGNRSVWHYNLYLWLAFAAVIFAITFSLLITSLVLQWPIWALIIIISGLLTSLFLPYLILKYVKSIYSSKPLRNIVYNGYDPAKTIKADKILFVGAVSWKKGIYEKATHFNEKIHEWVLASSAFPVFLNSRFINDVYYTDGGVKEIAPLLDAIDSGATEIDVYLCSPLFINEDDDILPALPEQLMRVIEIMSNEILCNDVIKTAELHPEVKITIYMPDRKLIKNSLNFKSSEIQRMYAEGKKAGANPLTIDQVHEIILRR